MRMRRVILPSVAVPFLLHYLTKVTIYEKGVIEPKMDAVFSLH